MALAYLYKAALEEVTEVLIGGCPQMPPIHNIELNLHRILLKVSTPSTFYSDCSAPAVSRFRTVCLSVSLPAASFIILNHTTQWARCRRRQLSVWETEGRVWRLATKRVKSLFSTGQETGTYRIGKDSLVTSSPLCDSVPVEIKCIHVRRNTTVF
jgi:hypothetical protein